MNIVAKALFIVEGARMEPRFFTRMSKVCELDLEIVPLCTNIYRLYQKLKDYGFDYDVRVALKELVADEESQRKLAEKYAYTYLIFDCDAHHNGLPKNGESVVDIAKTVGDNYDRLMEMLGYFTDETDPDRGRLFINYPMMESYRDCNAFFDESFKECLVQYEELSNYKQRVGRRKMANRRVNTLSKDDFTDMTRMNLYKLAYVLGQGWTSPSLEQLTIWNVQVELLNAQRKYVPQRIMYVINTSLFVILDYNTDGHFLSSSKTQDS